MSKLEELILKNCPKGVKFAKIKEICSSLFAGGTPNTSHSEYYDGEIPWLRSGEIDFNEIKKAERNITDLGLRNSSAKWIKANSVLMAMTGATVAKVATNTFDTTANQSVCAMEVDNQKVNYKYLYYILELNYHKIRSSAQGALTSLNLAMIKEISIPLPPLPVQEEIVRILDSMADLQNNIEAELKERKKQYEHYREQILGEQLSKLCPDGVGNVRLGSIVKVVTAPKKLNKKDYLISGIYPIVDQGQKFIVAYTNDESALVPKDDYVIFGDHTREIKFVNFKFAQGADGVKILKSKVGVLPRYLYYSMTNLDIINRGYNRHWTIVQEMEIPLPPLPVQEEIVRILDSMTALQDNLEAELVERRKQYEYYRNKILSFE